MGRTRRGLGRRVLRGLGIGAGALFLLVLVLVAGLAANLALSLYRSEPVLEGTMPLAGLSGPVAVERDAAGVPVIRGKSRVDVARALGFLHGQERFFQMDLQRRLAAGELAEVTGVPALEFDRRTRIHRFRPRAQAIVEALAPEERALLDAYAAGVNAGLSSLGARPFEYALLLDGPKPWQPEDTILTVFAMAIQLQSLDGRGERQYAEAVETLGQPAADFLFPRGSLWDSPLDGSRLDDPPLPNAMPRPKQADGSASLEEPPPARGSNAWAVGGALTGTGAALVADDMHLGLSMPNTWYRARLVVEEVLDITGVTLPGTPITVAGSNGRIAWGFTNSYIDTSDLVLLEPVEGQPPGTYRTPDGPKAVTVVEEQLCARLAGCEALTVEETIWGPVVHTDEQGRKYAYRWTAHERDAVRLAPMLELEQAGTVAEAVGIAHRARIPQQNFVVGDREGSVAWTIIGAVPARFGHDGRVPVSWADGTRGWLGTLPAEAIPVVLNPDDHRIWTANTRVLGGEAYAKLGDGGYDLGARARQIRDALFAKDRFAPADMLAIQLDDSSVMLGFWQEQLLKVLEARAGDKDLAPWLPFVRDWGGRAVPDSVGYRLVRGFRSEFLRLVHEGYLGKPVAGRGRDRSRYGAHVEGSMRRLLEQRPAGLVPDGYKDWDAVIDAALAGVKGSIEGDVKDFTWGERAVAGVRHPLARIIPGLSLLTDPPEQPVPGDTYQPRAQAPGFGASQRFAVSPGHEADGIFHMPGGQSGHPWSPYYLAGHTDWLEGRPTPFLPGPAKWVLTLEPGGG